MIGCVGALFVSGSKREVIIIKYIACSLKGENNELSYDRVLVNNHIVSNGMTSGKNKSGLVAICDGVNSISGSDIAANTVVTNLLLLNEKANANEIINSFQIARNEINKIQDCISTCADISTTVAGLVINRDEFLAVNIGDTRIYRLNSKGLNLLTRDHTVAQQKLDCGIVSENQITKQDYNTLTRYIGSSKTACHPSIKKGFIKAGDLFILCSDGIYKYITDEELESILKSDMKLIEKERTILHLALQNGSCDDLSMVLLETA